MATSANAKLMFEAGATLVAAAAMTDSGDHKTFTVSGGPVWSQADGHAPTIMPNGIVTGRNILSTHATDDTITIAAFTAYSKGVLHEVAATSTTITRPTTDVAQVFSVTMTDAGEIAVVDGTEGATTAFSETRGVAGGPPEIPADSVEIGQVRVTASTSAVIAAGEIYQVIGAHVERFDFPVWTVNAIGSGDSADSAAEKNAHIIFADELGAIHTSGACKNVYISYSVPMFQECSRALDFVPAETTHSVSSTQVYNSTIGSVSSSLGQGSFTAIMDDNVTDTLIAAKNDNKIVKFWPDRNKSPYILTQGKLGFSRTFPAGDQNKASVTISAEVPSAGFSS